MTPEIIQNAETNESNIIDDLTLEETKTKDVKGGGKKEFFIAESFGFGVEREMK